MTKKAVKKHSSTGASSASRWFACPGSIRLIEKAPKQPQNRYAAEGTAAHELAEKCLKEGSWPDAHGGEIITIKDQEFDQILEFEVDDDMMNAVSVYLEEIRHDEDEWIVKIENKIDLSRLYPGLYGTADAVKLHHKERRLKVIDYKHGKGVPVEVEGNKQALYYVLGAIESIYQDGLKQKGAGQIIDDPLVFGWDQFDEVELVIVQPRARHRDGPVRRWVIPKGELDRFQDELVLRAKATAEPDAPLHPGAHCKFCPALATCPAQDQYISDQTAADFKPLTKKEAPVLPAVDTLSLDRLIGVLKYADQISSWIKAVEAHAFTLLSHGESIPGFKLVKKKANRRWKNPEEARSMLSLYMTDADMLTVPELKSPAQVEKSLKKAEKDLLKPYIEVPDTGLTLAEESDPREAILGGSVVDDFKKLN